MGGEDQVQRMIALVKKLHPAKIERGLKDREFATIESRLGFVFPEDLRAFLAAGVPIGDRWPNWRSALKRSVGRELLKKLKWPLEGMLFDIKHNTFWDPEWGDRPVSLEDASSIATSAVRAAPALIPVYSHRYLPAEPTTAGNPVLSVYQTDIIVYGRDVLRYLDAEVNGLSSDENKHAREVRCWTRWARLAWQERSGLPDWASRGSRW